MMRRISLSLLATTAIGVVACQGALAADILRKAPPPAPVAAPIQDWSGIYVGLEAGYGWGKENLNPAFDPFFFSKAGPGDRFAGFLDPTISSVSQSGWLAGGFVGAQKQWGNWVLGIESDFDWADIKGTTNATSSACAGNATICAGGTGGKGSFANVLTRSQSIESKIDELGSVRGKVGWAFWQNWMIYGTGGLALAHTQDNLSSNQTLFDCPLNLSNCTVHVAPEDTFVQGLTSGNSRFGWTVGAGLDYKWQIDPGSAVIFGVEYLHYQFEGDNRAFGDNFGDAIITNSSLSVDTIKGRISYLFSIH